MKIQTLLAFTCLILGCKSLSQEPSQVSNLMRLQDARRYLEAGELHQAKIITENYLRKDPENAEGQKLMAEILEKELARHKEIFESGEASESDEKERKNEIRTWLERAKSLAEIQQYDEATLAAENVFIYDPGNEDASKLIDEIKRRAMRDGKYEIQSEHQAVRDEIDDRITIYKQQARTWFKAGQWGAARLAAEKVLLLEPEDQEALEILDEIQHQQAS